MNTYGNILYYAGKLKYSLEALKLGMIMQMKYYGDYHSEIATNYNNLAHLMTSMA